MNFCKYLTEQKTLFPESEIEQTNENTVISTDEKKKILEEIAKNACDKYAKNNNQGE